MRMRAAWAAILLMGVSGCRRALPELPVVDTSGFQGEARARIEAAARDAKAQPESPEAVARFGMTLHAHSQYGAAAACYERAAALDPKRYEVAYYLGLVRASDGRYADAQTALRRALRLRPDSLPAQLALADALLSVGEKAEAQRIYRRLVERDARVAAGHYGLGRTLAGAEAIREFEKALELFPRYGAAQFALAGEYRKAGEGEKARAVLANYERDKLVSPPLDDPALEAVMALNAGAIGLLRQAQNLDREGRTAEALALHERAIAADPKLAQAHINLISLYGRLGKGAEAEQAYRRAVELAPGQAEAYYNFGVFCFGQERWKEAQAAFEKAVELAGNHAEALHNLGAVVERHGQLDRAAELYRRAIAAKPAYRLARFHLGRIYANQRRYPQAIAEFEKTLEPVDESTPGYLYALAATHARAGSRNRSRELMGKAQEMAAARGQTGLVESIDRDLRVLGAGR